mmetsp:Transcript_529/g.3767  ORF Transcript_529/g.3767 Transcript_529/m.3767 type:complete len:84 (+) Transcript_529:1349-1600(+)
MKRLKVDHLQARDKSSILIKARGNSRYAFLVSYAYFAERDIPFRGEKAALLVLKRLFTDLCHGEQGLNHSAHLSTWSRKEAFS